MLNDSAPRRRERQHNDPNDHIDDIDGDATHLAMLIDNALRLLQIVQFDPCAGRLARA
jgi:hypothetical protein